MNEKCVQTFDWYSIYKYFGLGVFMRHWNVYLIQGNII